ncbi:MAG: glycosyltransferase family 2 protein [Saprospiraceae bacterium]|nr:glycosyltransferase family 2 protein [Saprospiraceae bacterium]
MVKQAVAIILINYNSSTDTLECVKSIEAHTSPDFDYEMVVVDNNSAIDDFKKIEHLDSHPKIKLIRSKKNLGFGGGHMFGLQFTHADYVLFLNNDCLFLNDVLPKMHAFMQQHPDCGIATAQMHDTDGNWKRCFNYFQTIWIKIFGYKLFQKLWPQKFPSRNKVYTSPLKVDYVMGAFIFVDSKKFAEIGGFDTNLFLYFEEEDISLRMRKLDYSTYLVPQAQYLHHHEHSSPKDRSIIIRELSISQAYLFRKHYSLIENIVFRLFYFVKYFFKGFSKSWYFNMAFFVLRGAPSKKSLFHLQKWAVDE